jgi:hypothetical protein
MIRNTQLALLGILVGAGQAAAAAENATLQVSGSVRARYEYLDGQYRPGLDARDDQLAVRSTLQAQWRRGSWRLVGELFDSRAYAVGAGSAVSANDVNTFEPVQAYVQRDLAGPFAAGSSVRAGRFTLNLGSRRLVASDDYRNTPQGSTGVHADLRAADSTQYQLFYVLPQQHRPDDLGSVLDNDWKLDHEGRDLTLWGALVTRPGLLPGGTLGEVGYVGLREKDDPPRATRDRRLHTFNVRALREPAAEQVDFEVEGIVQAGSISASTAVDAARQDVNAWFLHAEAGYTRAACHTGQRLPAFRHAVWHAARGPGAIGHLRHGGAGEPHRAGTARRGDAVGSRRLLRCMAPAAGGLPYRCLFHFGHPRCQRRRGPQCRAPVRRAAALVAGADEPAGGVHDDLGVARAHAARGAECLAMGRHAIRIRGADLELLT